MIKDEKSPINFWYENTPSDLDPFIKPDEMGDSVKVFNSLKKYLGVKEWSLKNFKEQYLWSSLSFTSTQIVNPSDGPIWLIFNPLFWTTKNTSFTNSSTIFFGKRSSLCSSEKNRYEYSRNENQEWFHRMESSSVLNTEIGKGRGLEVLSVNHSGNVYRIKNIRHTFPPLEGYIG